MDFEEIADRARNGHYYTALPAGEPGTEAREAYRRDAALKENEFRAHLKEALARIGVPAAVAGLVSAFAWEDGHAHGYSEVVIHADRLGELAARAASEARRGVREGLIARLEGVKHIARESFIPLIDEVCPKES